MNFDLEDFLEKTHDFGPELQRKILVEKRLEINEELNKVKLELNEAQGRARERGRFLPAEEFARINDRKRMLGYAIQKIQVAMGELGEKIKQRKIESFPLSQHFIDAAREILPKEVFRAVMDEAYQRTCNKADSVEF